MRVDQLTPLGDAVRHGADSMRIPSDAALVLAVSGGADSMALLHGAAQLVQSSARQWRLSVAHLDHALRPGSADDATFVEDAAGRLGLPFTLRRTDVAALARAEGRSIEDAGREARYRFLNEVAAEEAASIATAHTADDAAETVLLNLLRGAGPAGVHGIPQRRGRIVRPLIGERRAALRAALDAADVAYRDDPSNENPAYLRNCVRHELLPLMERLRAGAVDAIARFSAIAAADDALLDELAAAELARRRDGDEIDWRDPPPRALGRRVLRIAIGQPTPSLERLDALLDAAEGERGGLRVELGGKITASVLHRRIRVDR
ncbi:MAG: tRNA lysidine(34) synthetase TilS [Chloroflexota bacterium]